MIYFISGFFIGYCLGDWQGWVAAKHHFKRAIDRELERDTSPINGTFTGNVAITMETENNES